MAEGTGFQWEYCDVGGDRLLEAYRISPEQFGARLEGAHDDLALAAALAARKGGGIGEERGRVL